MNISNEEYKKLTRSHETLEWLQDRGLCWRGVDEFDNDWRVGCETEWHYLTRGDVRDVVDSHVLFLDND